MMKKALITFYFCMFSMLLMAQIPPKGITLITTRRGEVVMEIPAENSERHKFRVFTEDERIEFKLVFCNYENGRHKAETELLERIRSQVLSPGENCRIEIVPELLDNDQLFKVFFLAPSEIDIRKKITIDNSKRMKYLFFSYESKLTSDSYVPILIAYEDDKETNEIEELLRPFIKNGLLLYNEQSDKIIKEQIKQYSLLFYTTKIF